MTDLVTLAGLFGSAFLAATLIPAQSEALLFMLGRQGEIPAATLLVMASLGNILGSIVNWILGRSSHRYRDRRWFPMKPDQLARAEDWYRRWGWWTLLGSWLPVVGDPLTLIAGAMKEPFWRFLLVVSIAKAGRYAVVLSMKRENPGGFCGAANGRNIPEQAPRSSRACDLQEWHGRD